MRPGLAVGEDFLALGQPAPDQLAQDGKFLRRTMTLAVDDPDAAPEERINIYTMDEIKEGMETYTAPPTDYPGAEEDALEMDCEPG